MMIILYWSNIFWFSSAIYLFGSKITCCFYKRLYKELCCFLAI